MLRANLQSFTEIGDLPLTVSVVAGGPAAQDSHVLSIRQFNMPAGQKRNVILFIGDAMGTAFRDAARLVSRATLDSKGKNSFREGFFDSLLEMDKMPVSGMSMTYGSDAIVPDSATPLARLGQPGTRFGASVNSFTDGTDCQWRFNGLTNAANLQ